MVPPQQCDTARIPQLEREEEADAFDGEVAAIDIVAHKKQPVERWRARHGEELEQIVDLAVDVTTHSDWGLHARDRILLRKHLLRLVAELRDVVLRQLLPLIQPDLHLRNRRALVRQRYGLLRPRDDRAHLWNSRTLSRRAGSPISNGSGRQELI